MPMKKFFASLLLSLVVLSVSAQALPALLVPSTPRAQALGGVAPLPEASHLDAQAVFGLWAPQTAGNMLAGSEIYFRTKARAAFSFEGRAFLDRPYETASAQGTVRGTFRPSDLILGLGATVFATDFLSVGLKARMVSSSIAENAKGNAFCGDVSVTYHDEMFYAGLSGRNLGTKISYGGDAYALPMLVSISGGVKPAEGLNLAGEVDYLFAGALMAGFGAEYCIQDIAFLRAGFHYGDAAKALPTFVSLGAGVQFAGIHLDLSFITASKTIGNSLMVGLGYAF